MIILVCGSRDWHDRKTMRQELSKYVNPDEETVIVHGNNGVVDEKSGRTVKGADKMAGEIGSALGFTVIAEKAEWEKYHLAAGPIRNQRMLDKYSPRLCLAFHDNLAKSKGTRDMVARCYKAGVKVVLIASEKGDAINAPSIRA